MSMRPIDALCVLSAICATAACSPINPLKSFPDEIVRAEAAHAPIFIYDTSFGIYYNSEHPRKRSVGFVNTSGRTIDVAHVSIKQCISVSGNTKQVRSFNLVGPFLPGGHYVVESTPPEGVIEREIIVGLSANYADGQTDIYRGDIAAALAPPVVNHCPSGIFMP